MRVAMAALVVLTALAGCGEGGGKGAGEAQDFSGLDLVATEQTGVIRGVVVDQAIAPVEGALVTLTGHGNTTTSADGLFGFDGLEPGTYFLQVSKRGFGTVQQGTDVQPGVADPPIVKVLLQADPSSLPYVVAHGYSAFIECSFKVANQVGYCDPTGSTGNYDAEPTFDVERMPLYYQSEMVWEPTQALGNEMVTIQESCDMPDCGGTTRICNVRGPSPIACRVNQTEGGGGGGVGLEEAGMGDGRGYRVQLFANCYPCLSHTPLPDVGFGHLGVGFVYQQRIEVVNHLFYGYQPPADWLFVESGTVPEPPR